MAFSFASHALIDSATLSKFVWGVNDAADGAASGSGLPLTSQQVFSVELMVNAISRQIMRHVSSDIKAATYTEVWDGAGTDEFVPTERPINSVSSLKFAPHGDFSTSENLVTAGNGLIVTADEYSIKLRGGMRTPAGRGLVQVVYNAGYSTVPEDIQLATLLQFQWAWKQLGRGDAMVGVQSISKGPESQTKDAEIRNLGLRSEVVGLLKPYCRLEAPLSIMFTRVS